MKKLFNIKMRASRWDNCKSEKEHISGAERIVNEDNIEDVVNSLVYRALNHDKGQADSINISIDKIDIQEIIYIPCVDISTINSNTPYDGRQYILELLKLINIEGENGRDILYLLDSIDNMRGAVLLDLSTMKRLEKDEKRGIRVTGMDWEDSIKSKLEETLDQHGLNNNHVKEALALASKVIYPKGVLGEICISDDPNYTTGYVTIKSVGYFRIMNLKNKGSKKGGRIFLFDSNIGNADEYIKFLEKSVAIVNTLPKIKQNT